MYLWLGAVDETAAVWLNGSLLGTSAEPGGDLPRVTKAFLPFEFDAKRAVRCGEANTVAVKVGNRRVDGIGAGGITAPVMLWSAR